MDTAPIERLRADLAAADFTVDALTAMWGADASAALHRGHRLPAIRATAAATALSTLARVFVLGLRATRSELDSALPQLRLDGAVELGLVSADGAPLLDLRPYSFVDSRGVVHWWIASDLGELVLGHPIPERHVLGVGGASMTLSGLMVAEAAELSLDLGTGCGIQALHAARHSRKVIATDISPRALELASMNAALNGVTNIEFRLGSLLEPVRHDCFDHIVSNPPFVITPRGPGMPAYEYRDGGMVGDAVVAELVRSAGKHLQPGGIAQLLGNWEYRPVEDGLARVETWIDGTGLDAWVIERERQDVALYAETWIRDGGLKPGPDFDRLYDAWLDDFTERGVTEVGFGYLLLRRPASGIQSLRRIERINGQLGDSLGAHISASLAAHDWLWATDDAALEAAALTVAPDVTEQRHYWPGDEHPTAMDLRQGSGFARTVPLSTALAAVVGACDGALPLGAICAAVAELLDTDAAALIREVLPEVRELVFAGFLRT